MYLFLPHCYLDSEVTGKSVNRGGGGGGGGYGLEIPARFRFHGPEKATQWLEMKLTKIEGLLKESLNYCLK